ncbi:hypothetical protein SPRG_20035 [Saprolegnia parasitica CBS 223.65]|uniref:Uncharacterized protein n=1 Tax=Saprolegnia parasitica (strain CBS 223.65) TaxID=695850 RepID=A0A067CEB7_SAPPC|nr:hypothetical protein SPRG_20035 [Saprolegnia parasitica CBS 223.65]KDO28833.1 hypothetical protein SPRG_20035 [Saprolegnia parasitica CBS 223.65]|eukprot:XP_012200563.1 hypothetical protein SPRG_20035 [Saprolegnia parasitica CBS 223.65]
MRSVAPSMLVACTALSLVRTESMVALVVDDAPLPALASAYDARRAVQVAPVDESHEARHDQQRRTVWTYYHDAPSVAHDERATADNDALHATLESIDQVPALSLPSMAAIASIGVVGLVLWKLRHPVFDHAELRQLLSTSPNRPLLY